MSRKIEQAKRQARRTRAQAHATRTTLAGRVERVLLANPQPLTVRMIEQLLAAQGSAVSRSDVEAVLQAAPTRFAPAASHPTRYVLVEAGGPTRGSATDDAPVTAAPSVWAPARRTPGLPQLAWRPSFAVAPFRMGWTPLSDGQVSERSWGVVLSRLQETIAAFDYNELVVTFVARISSDSTVPVEIRINRVVDETPFWVAWVVSESAPLSLALFDCGWHLWHVWRPANWAQPAALLDRKAAASVSRLVATWRADTPHVLARAVLATLHDVLGMRRTESLALLVVRPSDGELQQRRQELERREHVGAELVGRGFARFPNPVRGMCALCGRPLRDPLSHERGIGPVCWERVRDLGLTMSDTRTDIPLSYWVGAQPEQRWRASLVSRLRVLQVRDERSKNMHVVPERV